MIAANALSFIRLLLLVALGVSSALWVDYASGVPTFCGVASGCEAVRATQFAYPFGIPLPAIAVVGLFAIFCLSFVRGTTSRAVFCIALALVGVLALSFLVIQAFVIGEFCSLCVAVDTSLIAAAVLAWVHRRGMNSVWLKPWAWFALALSVIAAPFLWTQTQPPPALPSGITDLYESNKVNAVLFADFACPHCKALHPRLVAAFDSIDDGKANLVSYYHGRHQKNEAVDLNASYLCAQSQQASREMAALLFRKQGRFGDARSLAAELQLDIDRFEHCLTAPETKTLLKANEDFMHGVGITGFPTLFIGNSRLVGDVSDDRLNEAITEALVYEEEPTQTLSKRALFGGSILWFILVIGLGRIASDRQNRASFRN